MMLLNLCSIFVGGIITFLIIAFAGNQIAAIGVLKTSLPVFLIVGISAAFFPGKWVFPYYALPMYWQYPRSKRSLGQPAGLSAPDDLATGLPWFAAVMYIFTKRLK
jgi:hypothetical protein